MIIAILATAGLLIGGFLTLITLGLTSIFFKDYLIHDPDEPKKLAWFVEVGKGKSVVIVQGDQPVLVIDGDMRAPPRSPPLVWPLSVVQRLWWIYKDYVFQTTRLHAYIPFFTEPKSYDLPRYRVKEANGRKVYEVVSPGPGTGYRSNHVRIEPSTWYFEYKGVDVQKIPFTVRGSAQVVINRRKVVESLFKTDAWNVLLDQVLNSSIRSTLRGELSVDDILGSVPNDIWEKPPEPDDVSKKVAELAMIKISEYKIKTSEGDIGLEDVGLEVGKLDITDFEDELEPAQRAQFLRAVLAREEGRALDLVGQGAAAAQKRIKEVHGDGSGASDSIIRNDALVRAVGASKGNGLADAILAAFLGKTMR